MTGTGGVRVVAIDGPAGAGKSTLAQAVAAHLGFERLDTGAMYRSVAWSALAHGVDVHDAEAVARLAKDTTSRWANASWSTARTPPTLSARGPWTRPSRPWPPTRPCAPSSWRASAAWVAERGRGVVEGRDIGTVVLPDADVKIYLTAATETRARRRARQRADGRSVASVHDDLVRRDRLDSTRLASPLPSPEDVAVDAKVIDSTGKSSRPCSRRYWRACEASSGRDRGQDHDPTARRGARPVLGVPHPAASSCTSSTGRTGASRSRAPMPSPPRAR